MNIRELILLHVDCEFRKLSNDTLHDRVWLTSVNSRGVNRSRTEFVPTTISILFHNKHT